MYEALEEQAAQTYSFSKKTTNLEKRLFLMEIFNTNRTLFTTFLATHLPKNSISCLSTVYNFPIENYDDLFVDTQYAGYLDINHLKI